MLLTLTQDSTRVLKAACRRKTARISLTLPGCEKGMEEIITADVSARSVMK